MPTVRNGPIGGLITQISVLAGLGGTVHLGVTGWLAGLAYGVATCVALTLGLERSGAAELGPANRVTLIRATLVGGVVALVVESVHRPVPVAVLAGLAIAALVLDAVDGRVARRTGSVTALGARFDVEVDAALALMLSAYVARPIGAWVLAIGAMRYALVVARWMLPWLRGSVPARYWRKVVAATQGVVLVVAAAGVVPRPLMVAALVASLAMLVESFGSEVVWLWRHRPVRFARPRAARSGQMMLASAGYSPGRPRSLSR